MNFPKISVIVPVYNVEKYLRECLDSIINQTFTDYELILVDDGSKDESGRICDEYAVQYKNIIVVHQKNQGQSVARNNGVKIAKAEWVMFVDSDDYIHQQALEFLYKAVLETRANISFFNRVEKKEPENEFFNERTYYCNVISINEDTLINMFKSNQLFESNIYWLIYPKLIRKSLVEKYSFKEGRIFEDNEVSCKWLVESGSIAIIPEEMYFYRDNPTGTMNSKFSLKKLDYLWALEQQIEYYHSIGYSKIMKLVIEEYIYNAVYLGKQIISELHDEEECKKLMIETEKKMKKFFGYCDFEIDVHTKNFIMKYAHPLKFKFNKILKSVFN